MTDPLTTAPEPEVARSEVPVSRACAALADRHLADALDAEADPTRTVAEVTLHATLATALYAAAADRRASEATTTIRAYANGPDATAADVEATVRCQRADGPLTAALAAVPAQPGGDA